MNFFRMREVFNVLSNLDFGKKTKVADVDSVNQVLNPNKLNYVERDIIVQLLDICSEYKCSQGESMMVFDLCKNVLEKGCRPGNFYSSDDRQVDGMILTRAAFNDLLTGYLKRVMMEHSVLQPTEDETDLSDREQAEELPKESDILTSLFQRIFDIEDELRITRDLLSIINSDLINNYGAITEKKVEAATSGLLVVEERLKKIDDDLNSLPEDNKE